MHTHTQTHTKDSESIQCNVYDVHDFCVHVCSSLHVMYQPFSKITQSINFATLLFSHCVLKNGSVVFKKKICSFLAAQ